jgi:predicted phosphodiesterase
MALDDEINNTDAIEMDKYKKLYDTVVTSEEYQVAKMLSKKSVSKKEVETFIKAIEAGNPSQGKEYRLGTNHAKLLVISDSHIGNINYDPKLNDYAVKIADKENVDAVLHVGDIADGWYQNRPTQLFEMNAIGLDAQMKLAVKELSKYKQPLYFITGNHEYNSYMRGAGVEFGSVLEEKLGKDAHFLGNAEGDLILKNGCKIKLLHPDGGSSYAISYKSQKIIESLEGGKKPNVLLIGHFHKSEYIFYRNIHCIQAGTLEGQTKFMKGNSLSAHKGFWLLDIEGNTKGDVTAFTSTFYPSYR